MFWKNTKKRIYLDYASATPVRSEVLTAMAPFWSGDFGNAGAIHKEGLAAKHVIAKAREKVARVLHVRPQGIVFTSSGTESNNLAIMGVVEARHKAGVLYADMEVISTVLEHASVLQVLTELRTRGVGVIYTPVDEEGIILTEAFKKSLSKKTVLVTCALVNSEIGVIQPIGKLSRIVRAYEKEVGTEILIHVDGAQAPLWLSCTLDSLGADMLSLDAGKCYGPKGMGLLAYIHKVLLSPYLFGGDQEHGVRPGTENTALIVGGVEAICLAQEHYTERSERVLRLRNFFISTLEKIEGIQLNGSVRERVANNANISITGVDSEFAVITLDEKGVACATKSACGGAKGDGSSVVYAMTGDKKRATTTIRFTLGEATTQEELQTTALILREHVEKTRLALASFPKID
jgi:cysteine desulfurase